MSNACVTLWKVLLVVVDKDCGLLIWVVRDVKCPDEIVVVVVVVVVELVFLVCGEEE